MLRSERPGTEGIALRLFYDAAAALGDCRGTLKVPQFALACSR